VAATNDRSLALTLGVVADDLKSGLAQATAIVRKYAEDATAAVNNVALGGGNFAQATRGSSAITGFANTAKNELAKVEKAGRSVGEVYQRIFQAFVGAEVVKALLGMSIAADEFKEHFEIAAATAANMGHAFAASDAEAFVKKLALSAEGGGYAIESMAAAFQRFIAIGATKPQAEYMLETTAKLAAGLGETFDEAATQLERGSAGLEVSLRRVGISVKDAHGNMKSLDEIVKEINEHFATAAEQRAKSLAGQLGVVANSAALLRQEFGAAMMPALTLVLGGFERLLDWMGRLSPQMKTSIGVTIAVAAVLTTLGLICGVVTTAIEALAGALAVLTSPIGLVIAAIVAIIAVFIEAKKHPAEFHNALLAAFNAARDTVSRFVDFVKDRFKDVALIFAGVADALVFGRWQEGADAVKAGVGDMTNAYVNLGHTIGTSITNGFESGVDAAKKLWANLLQFLQPKELGHAGAGAVSLAGLGGPQKAGKGGEAGATNALDNLKSAIDGYLQAFADKVETTKQQIDLARAQLDLYKASEDPSKPKTVDDALNEQKLINAEIAAERAQQVAIEEQIIAKTQAERQYLAAAAAVSPHLKNHDELVRSAVAAAREQQKSAAELGVTWTQVAVAIAQGGMAIRESWKAALDVAKETAQASANVINDVGDAQRDALEEGLYQRNIAADRSIGALEQKKSVGQVQGMNPVALAQLNLQIAQIREAMAKDALATAQHIEAVYADVDAIVQTKESHALLLKSEHELVTATNAVTKAHNDVALATVQLQKDLDGTHLSFTKFMADLESKLGVSKLGLEPKASGGMSFDPMSLLLNAFEKTKAFADIQGVVNELLKVFAQMLDALRPVIDFLLRAVVDVANGFIDVWNAIASILRIFGIQLPILEKLTYDFSSLDYPLIQVVHDIPTLNELASGNVGPLSNQPTTPAQWNEPVTNSLASPALGGGLLDKLIEMIAILEAIHLLWIAFMAVETALQAASASASVSTAVAVGAVLLASTKRHVANLGRQASGITQGLGGVAGSISSGLPGGAGGNVLTGPGGQSGPTTVTMTNQFYGDINGYDDVAQLGTDLSDAFIRRQQISRYATNRVSPVGA
jgi:hypothetical protein